MKLYEKVKQNLDKLLHFLVCYFIVTFFGVTVSPVISIWLAVVAGIGKEVYDEITPKGSGWSWGDLLADALGMFSGVLIILIILGQI